MKAIKIFSMLALLFFSGCSSPVNHEPTPAQDGVTDFRGKTLRFNAPPDRVVCLIESALSGMYMLRQEARLIGVPSNVYDENLFGHYSRLDHRIKSRMLPGPGNWDFISIEQIVGLNPDLVIIWASQSEAIENLERFGIPVYAIMLHDFQDVLKEISDFGKLMDCTPRADSLIAYSIHNMTALKEKYKTKHPKSVYFMWAQAITETAGLNSTVNELLEFAGTRNACTFNAEHVTVSIEKIYDWNPDLIVMWYNERFDPGDILSDPLLQGLDAVKKGAVYELPDAFSCDFWTLKMQYPAELIARWACHGELPDSAHARLLYPMYSDLYDQTLR